MAIRERLTRFEIDLLNEESGKYLGTIVKTMSGINKSMPYKIGDDIPLTEQVIAGNNSSTLRSCFVNKITQDELLPYRYTFYLKPDVCDRVVNGIDWSGSDGWLQLDSK